MSIVERELLALQLYESRRVHTDIRRMYAWDVISHAERDEWRDKAERIYHEARSGIPYA